MRVLAALIPTFIALFMADMTSATDIYTWKDKEGRTNYADNPPPGDTPARTLSGRISLPVSSGTTDTPAQGKPSSPSLAEQEMEFRKRRAEASEKQVLAEKAAADADERRKNCERARNQLAALESGQRIARHNDKGEREFLDERQLAEEKTATRKAVDSWCK
jgi:hypothetical protein